jgi:Planctomycete cytochrome C
MMRIGPFIFILSLLTVATPAAVKAAGKLQFNRDIRPILSDKCFHCHGPDSKKREADLRLDDRQAAIKDGHITPGRPEESLILERILTHDPDEVMPPPESKLGALTAQEAATLQQWIREGAEYEVH